MLQFSPDKSEMGIMQPDPVTKSVSLRSVNFFYPETNGEEAHSAVRREVPLSNTAQKQDAGPESNVASAEQDSNDPQRNPRLTFVVLNDKRSIAIVDDHVMHEGDSFGSITVRKIEQDRVLVGNKIVRWIYMEEEK
jgi:hypothetical protein